MIRLEVSLMKLIKRKKKKISNGEQNFSRINFDKTASLLDLAIIYLRLISKS